MRTTRYGEPSDKEIDALRKKPMCPCGAEVSLYGELCEECEKQKAKETKEINHMSAATITNCLHRRAEAKLREELEKILAPYVKEAQGCPFVPKESDCPKMADVASQLGLPSREHIPWVGSLKTLFIECTVAQLIEARCDKEVKDFIAQTEKLAEELRDIYPDPP